MSDYLSRLCDFASNTHDISLSLQSSNNKWCGSKSGVYAATAHDEQCLMNTIKKFTLLKTRILKFMELIK